MRNLDTVITHCITIGPMSTFKYRLKRELRDYFAHEIMRFEQRTNLGINDGTARAFFDTIFKDIPAIKKETEK